MHETLLLVDDEEGIRTVLGISLRDAGYNVITAANAAEALALFAEHRPEIILTDIKMPGLSGIELLDRVKALDPRVGVIMLTGHGDLDLAIQSLKLDASDFLTKPINDDILFFALNRVRERIAMRKQLRDYTENLENMVREKSSQLVGAERHLAALQVMVGMTSGIRSLTSALTHDTGAGPGGSPQEANGLFSELPCFVAVHNPALEIVYINELYRERLGNRVGTPSRAASPPPAAPGTQPPMEQPAPGEPAAPESAAPEPSPVERVLETGEEQRGAQTVVDKNGRNIPVIVHATPIYGNDGEIELVLELSVDTSEVRRLREELRLTRERYRQLFDESPCYIAVVDKDMRLLEANRRFRDDFGLPEGRHCHELYLHRPAPCTDCPAQRSFADGRPHQHETVVTTKDGRQNNVLVSTAPLRDAEGRVCEVMEMSTDITELRLLQDHLSQLGLLLGSTAHGIKGLLTALDGSVYRMGSGLEHNKPERVADGFKDMRHLVHRLRKMVLDILYYAKNRELTVEDLRAREFSEGILALVTPKAALCGVRLIRDIFLPETETAGGDAPFQADAGALSSALVNLLENAVEACSGNAHPPQDGHKVRFAVEISPEEITFRVVDNGPGMDRETREKLFTLFFSSKGSAGTGIGLFVADQVVRQHGGRIAVASEPGHGAAFTIALPRKQPGECSGEVLDL